MQQSSDRVNDRVPSQQGADDAGDQASTLAPAGMLVILLQILIGFYALNTIYNIVSFVLDPNGSFWRVFAPSFAALVLLITWQCVKRGNLQAGVIILAGIISLYDLVAYPLGYVPYYWAFWNQYPDSGAVAAVHTPPHLPAYRHVDHLCGRSAFRRFVY